MVMLTAIRQTFFLIQWNDYNCLRLLIADLLVSAGEFIHPGDNYKETRECEILSSTISEAGQNIYSTIPAILETIPIQEKHVGQDMKIPIGGFLVLWHLCCILKSPKISQSQQNYIRETLWSIGSGACIPHASALVRIRPRNA
jgi:hypothetical protein